MNEEFSAKICHTRLKTVAFFFLTVEYDCFVNRWVVIILACGLLFIISFIIDSCVMSSYRLRQ